MHRVGDRRRRQRRRRRGDRRRHRVPGRRRTRRRRPSEPGRRRIGRAHRHLGRRALTIHLVGEPRELRFTRGRARAHDRRLRLLRTGHERERPTEVRREISAVDGPLHRRHHRSRRHRVGLVVVLASALHLVPGERSLRRLRQDEHRPRLVASAERDLAAEGERDQRPRRVDPEEVGRELHLLEISAARREGARAEAGQVGDEEWMLGAQVLEDQVLVHRKARHLLIDRRDVEIPARELLRHRRRRELVEREAARPRGQPRPRGPGRRQRPEPDGRDDLAARDVGARRNQVRRRAVFGQKPDRVLGVDASRSPLVAERHLRERLGLAGRAARTVGAVAEHLDRLVDPGDDEARDQRPDPLAVRRERLADQHHVGAGLERRRVARRVDAPRAVVVPVVVVLVRILLLLGERREHRPEIERRLRHDRERERPRPRLPGDAERPELSLRDDPHPDGSLV